MREWSKYQTSIFAYVQDATKGNLIVIAVAGSGKSTTIVEATKRCDGLVIFLAFNKAIADELKKKSVNARTFHSLCFGPVMRAKNRRDPDTDKLWQLTDAEEFHHWTTEDAILYRSFVRKMVSLAKQSGIGCLIEDTEEAWVEIADHHDIEPESDAADFRTAIEWSRRFLAISNASPMVDFDDMLYFAVKDGISLPKFDWVFVDEAQDTNAIQRAILRKIMKPNSRLVAVGDPAQAIYGFRGADSQSLGLIAEEFGAETLPLSVSYRCATSIVDYARQWVGHIEPATNAPEGKVDVRQEWTVANNFLPTDLVVCRTTKPLISLGYKMLTARVPVRILGKEIGEGLVKLIEKQKAKGIDRLVEKLEKFREREVEKAEAAKKPGKAAAVSDKVDAILTLVASLPETERTVPELLRVINSLFADTRNCTTLCTIHKSKGLEAERVFWLNRSACPSPWAKQEWMQEQERNLCYVAATRAKRELVLIEDEKLVDELAPVPAEAAA